MALSAERPSTGSARRTMLLTLLTAASLLFGLALAEVGYRTVLIATEPPPSTDSMVIYSHNVWTYDHQTGFDYVSDGRTHLSILTGGLARLCVPFMADASGNPGRPSAVLHPRRRIDVFGDSFTTQQHGIDGGITWPSLLEQRLNERQDGPFQVRNFARDGTGVLQMVDSAASVAETDRPDLIIIAFISNDLARRRIWRKALPGPDGQVGVFTSIDPAMSMAPGTYVRTTFIDERADHAWCGRLRQAADPSDATLGALRHAYQATLTEDAGRLGRRAELAQLDRSYLFDRIAHRDPYYGTSLSAARMWIDEADFSHDRQFVGALERLRHSGVPTVLVWLPQHEELIAGRAELAPRLRGLAHSLIRLSGFPLLTVRPALPADTVADYYNLPTDAHPSMKGLELFADAVAGQLPGSFPSLTRQIPAP
jgi:hypothetical protein